MTRSCGERQDNSLYATCELSPYGKPIEAFLVDPALDWNGPRLRSPMLVPDKQGVVHMILGVGRESYPYVSDFVEEARVMGVSKRLPRDFDPSSLSRNSKMLLVHPWTIPEFSYETDFDCPRKIVDPKVQARDLISHECLGALWPLSTLNSHRKLHRVQEDSGLLRVTTPSCHYLTRRVVKPMNEEGLAYRPGIFLALPITSFHYVSRKKTVPREVKERFAKSKIGLEVKTE